MRSGVKEAACRAEAYLMPTPPPAFEQDCAPFPDLHLRPRRTPTPVMTSDQKRGRQRDDRESLSDDEDAPEDSQHTRSGSDSDDDGSDEGKRARELEDDEAEALKRDLGQDLREGKRVRRAERGEVGETTVV